MGEPHANVPAPASQWGRRQRCAEGLAGSGGRRGRARHRPRHSCARAVPRAPGPAAPGPVPPAAGNTRLPEAAAPGTGARQPPPPGSHRRPAATAAQPRPRPLPAPSSPWRNARTGTGPPPVPPSHCASGAAGTGSPRPRHGDGCAEVTPSPRAALAWGSSCGRSCSGAKREPGVTSLFKTPHSSYRFFFLMLLQR